MSPTWILPCRPNEEFNSVVTGSGRVDRCDVLRTLAHAGELLRPRAPGDDGRTRPVVQSGGYGEIVGKVTLTSEGEGDWSDDERALLVDRGGPARSHSPVWWMRSTGSSQDAEETANEIGSEVVGTIDEDITRAFNEDGFGGPRRRVPAGRSSWRTPSRRAWTCRAARRAPTSA